MSEYLRAPFPWFGGKSKAAELIWSRLGHDIGSYVEPFLGSCAVYLNRPAEFDGWVTLNDLDGNVANFWRSIQNSPDEAAKGGGYQGADDRERIWFSPACIGSQKEADLFA